MISWTPSSEGSDCDLFSGADGAAEDLANELEIAEDRTEVFASEYEDGEDIARTTRPVNIGSFSSSIYPWTIHKSSCFCLQVFP